MTLVQRAALARARAMQKLGKLPKEKQGEQPAMRIGTYTIYNKTAAVLESSIDHPNTQYNALKYAHHALEYAKKRFEFDVHWWWVIEDIEGLIENFKQRIRCQAKECDCHKQEKSNEDSI